MERWEIPPPPHHRRNNPSFSSSLLDAICRSIDDESNSAAGGGNLTAGAQGHKPREVTRLHHFSTSSSTDSSSSYFSSSSDADSARAGPVRPKPARSGPILTRSGPIRSDPLLDPMKTSVSIKKKLRDVKKSTSPSSPGAKLAGFLNSLFTTSSHKKPKISAADDPSPSICSSASSYSRSCLSKTPSTRGSTGSRRSTARSVRFCPVGVIVGEDCQPCGEKYVFRAEAASAADRARERRKKMVEELMKGFELEEDDDDVSGDESDDGSEDLFELENLAGISGGRFRDELPVYETTDLGMNCAIAKGLVV